MTKSLHILLVADDGAEQLALRKELSRLFPELQLSLAASSREWADAQQGTEFDLLFVDYRLRWIDSLAVLQASKTRWPQRPVVMIAEVEQEDAVAQALKAGLDDYVLRVGKRLPHAAATVWLALGSSWQVTATQDALSRYRSLFDGVPIGLYSATSSGELIDANPALVSLLGYIGRDALMAANLPGLHANHQEWARWQELMERDGFVLDFEAQMRRADGRVLWVEESSHAVRDDQGHLLYYEGSLHDITIRKEADTLIRESEERFRRLMETAYDAILVMDVNTGAIVDANARAADLLGKPAGNISGSRITELGDLGLLLRQQALAKDGPLEQVLLPDKPLRGPDGADRWVSVSTSTVDMGGHRLLQAIIRDVTEHKQLEGRARQVEKAESMSVLAAGVASDFNNMLMAITGYATLAKHSLPPSLPAHGDIDQVLQTASNASEMVQQLYTLSQRTSGARRIVDLNELLLYAQDRIQQQLGAGVELRLPAQGEPELVAIDPAQIEQVLFSLAAFAQAVMPAGGTWAIETGHVALDEETAARLGAATGNEYVRLLARDSGRGLGPETRAHIFDPFFNSQELGQGQGLGLTSVRSTVQLFGGLVECLSEPGKGTTFGIYLPRTTAPQQGLPLSDEHGFLPLGDETILVVEDETAVRNLSVRILGELGYTVLQATNGAEGLQVARENANLLDLVMTDMVMPIMDGRSLVEHLRADLPRVHVLVVSGFDSYRLALQGLSIGDVPFLKKPVAAGVLARKVREVLARRPQPAS